MLRFTKMKAEKITYLKNAQLLLTDLTLKVTCVSSAYETGS